MTTVHERVTLPDLEFHAYSWADIERGIARGRLEQSIAVQQAFRALFAMPRRVKKWLASSLRPAPLADRC